MKVQNDTYKLKLLLIIYEKYYAVLKLYENLFMSESCLLLTNHKNH